METLLPWKRFEVVWLSDKELVVQDWVEKTSPKAADFDEVLFKLKEQIAEVRNLLTNRVKSNLKN